MNDSTNSGEQQSNWQACSAGAIQEMAATEAARQRRLATARFGKLAVAILLVSSLSVAVLSSMDFSHKFERDLISFNCVQVIERMDQYLANDLPEAEHMAVRDHLKYCQWCQKKLDERSHFQQSELLAVASPLWSAIRALQLSATIL